MEEKGLDIGPWESFFLSGFAVQRSMTRAVTDFTFWRTSERATPSISSSVVPDMCKFGFYRSGR